MTRTALSLALFIVIASAAVLIGQTPGTAEFVVSVMSLAVGLIFAALVVLVARRGMK
ncbi:MAG: hypothetical protein RMN52_04305 [Anaerolineae bacterium]|nr:hypothetical protein [Candidatus Roseilinea sp.]MDW8449206.1 hypothetical protein [Anaerolineae bacterium]